MTVSETVCCRNVLCVPFVIVRCSAYTSGSDANALMIVRVLCEGRQCFIHIDRPMCICMCLESHTVRFLIKCICHASVSVCDQ